MVSSSIDYYQELNVDRTATTSEIRNAYKRLALLWHPDRNKAKDAEEKFKLIKQAYDILSDEQRRQEYDHKWEQDHRWFETTSTNNQQEFYLKTFENLLSTPIDPLDILSDLQMFQDSNFTTKMLNSPQYRQLYTQLFHSMNNPSSSRKHRRSSIPVIHSTIDADWFLNEIVEFNEQDRFFADLTHCQYCHQKMGVDRTKLIQHEQKCRTSKKNSRRYSTRIF